MAEPTAEHLPESRIVLFAYPLFFASGVAGLIYEVVWTRMLTTVLGGGIYAISAVLAAFMAGLALGAILLGRLSDRLNRPMVAYAVLEMLIGVAGLVIPLLVGFLSIIDIWVYDSWGQNFAVLTTFRFTLVLLVLLVPTTLMGGTLPIMSRALVRNESQLGRHVGGLYAINTIGAVVGAFLTGFWLIGQFGIFSAAMAAVFLNFLAALGALVLLSNVQSVRRLGGTGESPEKSEVELGSVAPPRIAAAALRLVLVAAFLTGVVSLAAQVIWSRTLIFKFGELKNTTYCFSAMLSVFLAGLALGSAVSGRLADRVRSPLKVFGILLCLLGISIAVSANVVMMDLPGFNAVEAEADSIELPSAVASVMLKTVMVLGLPTFLMGMAFPMAVKSVVNLWNLGQQVGWLYALNTIGAVVGALIAPFVIVPMVGLTGGLIVLGAADAAVGLAVMSQSGGSAVWRWGTAVVVVVALGAAWQLAPSESGLQSIREGESLVFYEESPVATVAVVEDAAQERRVSIDDVAVAGTTTIMQTDQKSLAHLGTLLVENPKSALTVGFGSGGASYSFLLHDRLEQVDCAEICPAVLRAAPYMTAANHGFLERNDPRYRVVFDDVSAYLRYTNDQYDIISSDCTDLKYKSSASLYDLEYFQHCREKLRPGGLVVAWMPLGGVSDETFRVALRTFYRVFPEMAVFYMHNEWTHFVLLIGWRDRMVIDFDRIADRLNEIDVREDLAEIGFQDPYKLLAAFVTSGQALDEYLTGDTLNTRDHPIIEFEAPKHGYVHAIAQQNLLALMQHRVSVRPWVVSRNIDWNRYQRYEQAVNDILQGQFLAKNMDVESATIAYLRALQLTPEDEQVQEALKFDWLTRLGEQGNPTAWLLLGRSQHLQGNWSRAMELFDKYQDRLIEFDSGGEAPSIDIKRQAQAWRDTASVWRQDCQRMLSSGPATDLPTEP